MAKKKQDASYDKPAPKNPQEDLEMRLGAVLKEVDALDKNMDRSADWYFIYQLLAIAHRYVQKRKKD